MSVSITERVVRCNSRAPPLLQRRDQPRYARGRQAKFARRRRKTLQVGHRGKGLHGVDTVHGIVS
jgi:hypothetical protein